MTQPLTAEEQKKHRHTLEFEKILERLREQCVSEDAGELAMQLVPSVTLEDAVERLGQTEDASVLTARYSSATATRWYSLQLRLRLNRAKAWISSRSPLIMKKKCIPSAKFRADLSNAKAVRPNRLFYAAA